MRLKDYAERDGKRVWLSEQEVGLFLNEADDDPEHRAAFLLAGRCGLRRQEIVDVTPSDIVSNDTGRIVRVWEGKGDKYREVPCPSELTDLVLGMSRDAGDSLVTVDPSTIYDWVAKVRGRCRARTGDEGWQHLGPHDLRRSWGVRLLEAGVLPSVVMEWGGWEDWSTFRAHYLAEFSPEALRRERGKVGWLAENTETESDQSYSAIGASTDRFSGR